jgi:hypothetical protein
MYLYSGCLPFLGVPTVQIAQPAAALPPPLRLGWSCLDWWTGLRALCHSAGEGHPQKNTYMEMQLKPYFHEYREWGVLGQWLRERETCCLMACGMEPKGDREGSGVHLSHLTQHLANQHRSSPRSTHT